MDNKYFDEIHIDNHSKQLYYDALAGSTAKSTDCHDLKLSWQGGRVYQTGFTTEVDGVFSDDTFLEITKDEWVDSVQVTFTLTLDPHGDEFQPVCQGVTEREQISLVLRGRSQ